MSEPHVANLKEAQRLRDLGYYRKALVFYEEAERERRSLLVAVEIASMHLEQGLLKDGINKIQVSFNTFCESTEDRVVMAMGEILQQFAMAFSTGQFTRHLEAGERLFNELLRGRPPQKLDKRMLSIGLCYAHLRFAAATIGVETSCQTPSQGYWIDLFQELVREHRFAEALRVAKVQVLSESPAARFELLDALLEESTLPDIVRAETLYEYADSLQTAMRTEESYVKLELADKFYRKVGHGTGPLIVDIQRLLSQIGREQSSGLVAKFERLQADLEDLGDWAGGLKAIKAMYEVALRDTDDELCRKLDRKLLHYKDVRGSLFDWCLQQTATLSRWNWLGPNSGMLLESLEALYKTLETMEMPLPRASVATSLSDQYKRLGNPNEAAKWAAKVTNAFPSRWDFMYGKDEFYNKVQSNTIVLELGPEAELEELRADIARTIPDISADTTPDQERYLGVEKICNMGNLYINTFQTMGFERAKSLAEVCVDAVDGQLQYLPATHSSLWRSNLMQLRSQILFFQAFSSQPINTDLLNASIAMRKQAIEALSGTGLTLQIALIRQSMGPCYQTLWIMERESGDSKSLEAAVDCYEEARKTFVRTGHASRDQKKLNIQSLQRLWCNGFENRVKIYQPRMLLSYIAKLVRSTGVDRWFALPKSVPNMRWPGFMTWFGFRTVSPLEETVKYLILGESLIDEERNDLSALNTKEALIAKQSIRNTVSSKVLYDLGIRIHMLAKEVDGVWEWVQKAKARSISDLLGLGINIPKGLKARLRANPQAQILLEEEGSLLTAINSDRTDSQFFLRKDLEALRKKMRNIECLREMLDLREGRSVSQDTLRGLRDKPREKEGGRRIFYADYFVVNNKVFLLVLGDSFSGVAFFDLNMTTAEAAEWRKAHLDAEKPLNTDDISPLQALSKLVAPLVQISNPDDLLVLCATDVLHSIPLHAATLGSDSEKPLIDRNPILYTASMTILEQCVSRASVGTRSTKPYPAAFCAVYEDSNVPGFTTEQKSIYDSSKKLAEKFTGAVSVFGSAVTRAEFKNACQSHLLYFYGHNDLEAENIMDQGLVLTAGGASPGILPPAPAPAPVLEGENDSSPLAPESRHISSQSQSTNGTPPSVPSAPERDIFTVSDIFSTGISASHITLIACASATQTITPGDEPLGIVTALLCAGASSVLGTMWPIASRAGREFARRFYAEITKAEDTNATTLGKECIVDVAVALQKAVKGMRKREETEEPFHWAGFVVHGSWFYRL